MYLTPLLKNRSHKKMDSSPSAGSGSSAAAETQIRAALQETKRALNACVAATGVLQQEYKAVEEQLEIMLVEEQKALRRKGK